MLHILWLIIKWIGIVLALLLAVLLLAAALVLFCPVRYCAKARKTPQEWEAFCRVSWLLGLASMTVTAGSAGSHTQIRLCGVKLAVWKRMFSRKSRVKTEAPPEKKQAIKKSEAELKPVKSERVEPETAESGTVKSEPVKPGTENTKDSKVPKKKKENFLKRLWRRLADWYRGILEAAKRIIAAIRNLCGTISLWKDFLGKTQTRAAFSLTWQQLLGLLRHAGPQKWKGMVELGLGSPSATGQLLAVLGVSYPLHRGRLSINPVWDRKVLEGDVRVKGRVYGAALLSAACRLYFDKNVKGTLQWLIRQAG